MRNTTAAQVLGLRGAARDPVDLARKGVPTISAMRLAKAGGLNDAQLAAALGISNRTLARKKGKSRGKLSPVESDRAVRLARVVGLAMEVFGNRDAVVAWLHEPIVALGGNAPVSLLDTDAGLRKVERALVLLEYGGVS